MSTQRKLKEIEFEFQNNEGENQIFVVREPTAEETNAADLIRSRAFFEAVDNGIRTETEILRRLKQQGRFNEEEHSLECSNLGIQLRDAMVNMSIVKTKDEIINLHQQSREIRESLMEKYRDKETFLQHSAEQKAENALNLALLGVCLEKKDGTPLFAVVKKDTQELDIEQTYNRIHNSEDTRFITTALSYFMPLVMGIDRDALREHPEDAIFKEKLAKITGEENAAVPTEKIKKPEPVYSPKKEDKTTSVAAPSRKPNVENVEIAGIDIASGEDKTVETTVEVPSFSMDEAKKEEPKPVEKKKAPVAPTFDTPKPIVTETPKKEPEPEPETQDEPIQPDEPQLPEYEEEPELEPAIAKSSRDSEEEVIKVGNDSGNIRHGKDDFVDRDGAARPFGAYVPPTS